MMVSCRSLNVRASLTVTSWRIQDRMAHDIGSASVTAGQPMKISPTVRSWMASSPADSGNTTVPR